MDEPQPPRSGLLSPVQFVLVLVFAAGVSSILFYPVMSLLGRIVGLFRATG
ncbi:MULTISPECIES: hypothetical protein [unclassified Phyllobacterium]|uniref:hypothetical protein n=1 Tax=Phyllobacterium TaxID=28100 RepID=UPI0015FA5DF9|nr:MULTISPECIES: hypothetical protein [unclassified Phyllobacterium]MBA8900028.1 hypothetical protein [Phyllobacterium sp. P30BS-XVII]UGX85993.1 hypothetical protein LLE53_016400 [Phyllobacterium sp. T1293]